MSDNFILVCTAKEVQHSEEKAKKVLHWLQEKLIVEEEASNCILRLNDLGYKPAAEYRSVIQYDEDIQRLAVCGLEIKIEREVFHGMADSPLIDFICPSCKHDRFDGITEMDFYTESLTEEQLSDYQYVFECLHAWAEGKETTLKCNACERVHPIEEYQLGGGVCLSNLGFTFWNWPALKDEFIEELAGVVGEEVKVINGHI